MISPRITNKLDYSAYYKFYTGIFPVARAHGTVAAHSEKVHTLLKTYFIINLQNRNQMAHFPAAQRTWFMLRSMGTRRDTLLCIPLLLSFCPTMALEDSSLAWACKARIVVFSISLSFYLLFCVEVGRSAPMLYSTVNFPTKYQFYLNGIWPHVAKLAKANGTIQPDGSTV